jgi:hypothetical protein
MDGDPDAPPPDPTAPESFNVCVRDWGDETAAHAVGACVWGFTRELSRYIDLSNLDGLTLGGDYPRALAELDRGYESTIVLTPSNDVAIGIAMTPSVIRDGQLKSHIVLNAGLADRLRDGDDELFPLALHTLAHECAHVEVTAAFDRCFPQVLLKSRRVDLQDQCRWDVILACWDEYAACRISAGFGEDPTEGYEQTLVQALAVARPNANKAIRAYRTHGDHSRIVREVYADYGRVMKYAAYLLGDLDARGLSLDDRPLVVAALEAHGFELEISHLAAALREVFAIFGAWTDEALFHVIGDIVDGLAAKGGVVVTKAAPGFVHIKVPFTLDTLPS